VVRAQDDQTEEEEGADETSDAPAERPAAATTQRLAAIDLQGQLLEPRDKLLRFLGLTAGAPFGQADQNRVDADLKALGYRQVRTEIEPLGVGLVRLHLTLEPIRVVRNVVVKGNWPLFDDEIVRHLSLRTGQPLPADTELRGRLEEEAAAVKKYLFNEGYFEARVVVEPHVALVGTPGLRRPRPHWIDLVVRVDLGPSYKLGDVVPTYDHEDGEHHMPKEQLYDIFHHWLRFKIKEMRDDQRKVEKVLRDLGYPAARVVCDFDFARDADRKTHRVTLHVRVALKRKVEVHFVGNRAITGADLRDQLTIFTAGSFDEVELGESARSLQREYQKHGYFEARVTFRRALRRGARDPATGRYKDEVEDITFTIEEGPELKVQKVEIVSESGKPLTFDPSDLKDKAELETKPFPPLGSIGLGEGGYVTQLQLQQDAERLAALYKSRGFPKVKVRSEVARDPAAFDSMGVFGAEVTGASGGHELYVRFYVDEGPREIVDHVEIDFIGPHVKDELDVYKAVQLGAGHPYTSAAEEDDLTHITDLYKGSGHPFVTIDPTTSTWNKEHDRVVLRYVITEGPEVRFGEILIRGNFKTRASTIRRDLPFKPGDLYDVNKIEAGERNLRTHLVFNDARVIGVPEPGRLVAPVVVTVQERYLEAYGSLTLAIGAASDRLPNYVYAQVTYLWANVLGYGSQLELKGDFAFLAAALRNPITWGASFRYTDIRLFGPGWRLDLTAGVRNEVTNRFGEIFTVGGSIGVTRNITPALRTFVKYDIYQANLNVGFVRFLSSNDSASATDNTVTTRVLTGIVWDRRVGADGTLNPLAPVKGWLLSGGVGYAHKNWVTDNPFVIFQGQLMGILPFKVRGIEFTLLGNLRYDEGLPTNEPALPLVERLFAGGDTTTRGYDVDSLKYEVIRTNISPLGSNAGFRIVPEGGNLRFLNTIELQFPIAKSFIGLPLQWSGAIFWDVGAISNGWDQLRPSDFKSSIGLTVLRLVTPVGPLSIEYAYPLNQGLAEERWKTAPWYSHFPGRIHFNWGIPLSRL
jgi:outer membrane protein assembly complex protein YaeT